MNEKIKNYVDELFKDAPAKRRIMEIREELLSNMNEKFNDLIRQGKSGEEAYLTVISGIGDIDGLINEVLESGKQDITAADKNKSALLVSVGVGLYIIGVAFMVLMGVYSNQANIGVVIMLCVFAAATAIIIYGGSLRKKRYVREDDSFVEEYREKITKGDRTSRINSAIASSVWLIVTVIYFILSFLTQRWDITWIVFIIGSVVHQVIYALMRGKMNTGGMLWTSAVVLYLAVSFLTWQWHVTWIIFIIAAAVQQITRLYNIWRET